MEAWLSASGPAMASGLATAGLTALGGATGTEALLLPGARGRVAQGVRGFWKEALKNVPAHAMKEVPEEFFDEMASTVIEAMALGKDPKEALGGFLAESPEFIGSVMLLGGSGGLHSSRQQAQAAAPVPLLPAQSGDRPVPVPPVAGGATGSPAEIQRPEASVPANLPLPTRPPAPAPSGLPMAVGDEVGGQAPEASPDPMPPGQPPQAVSNHPEMAQTTAPISHRVASPAPPIWQGRARHGEDAAVLGRNPDGTFQVRLNGAEKTFKESQVAAMTGMQRGPLHAHLAQATRQQLALPHPPSLPPIWQGRARHGEDAAVLGRNPDGTFQVRIAGQERTRTERDVAYMTGLTKAPLYEMLGRATAGRMGSFGNVQSRVEKGIDAAPEESGDLSADDWFKHLPVRGSFGGELFDMSQLDAIEEELAEHGVELVRNAEEFLANTNGGIAAGFQALGPNRAKFYLKSNATLREVMHELVHFRQFRDLGYDGYMALRKTGQHETQVWEWFLKNPDVLAKLNSAEYDAEWLNYLHYKK